MFRLIVVERLIKKKNIYFLSFRIMVLALYPLENSTFNTKTNRIVVQGTKYFYKISAPLYPRLCILSINSL
jgi:hypothetical protein